MYKVLIADDEKAIRNGLRVLIDWEGIGFEVKAVAANGLEAQKIVKEMGIDVVVTDIRMPKVDGLELAKYLRQEYASIDVILISGYQDFDYARKAIEYGVRNYLLKPLDAGQLTETLKKIKDARDSISETMGHEGGQEIILRIKGLVSQQYNEDITLNYIAKELCYNPVYLGRIFKQETGKSFRNYLNSYRVKKAAKLICENRYKIHEICEMVGYRDINYFCRVFKEAYGSSPSEFKQKNL